MGVGELWRCGVVVWVKENCGGVGQLCGCVKIVEGLKLFEYGRVAEVWGIMWESCGGVGELRRCGELCGCAKYVEQFCSCGRLLEEWVGS